MQSLNNTKHSMVKLVCPVAIFTWTGYFIVFLLAALLAGCSGGGESGGQAVTAPVVAITGPIIAVRVGETPVLDGSKSFASSSSPLSYSWSFAHKPDASNAKLRGATTENPSFVADAKGIYAVQLVSSANGVSSQRAIQLVVVTLGGEAATGPANHAGLSSNCVSCHDGVLVNPGKSPDHVATSNMCQSCHTPQGAAIIPFVDHLEVFGNCSECHNGVTAIGKSESHTPTDAECDNCHNTSHFLTLALDGSFDHTNITRGCNGCHNGTVATGKTASILEGGNHPNTSSECGSCHTTSSFLNAYPDHTGPDVVAAGITCDSCHVANGTGVATGQISGHPITNVDCDTCHSTETFSLGGVFNHRVIDPAVQRCDSCHNGTNSINAIAKTPTATHDSTTSDCGLCHNTESFAGAFVDHSNIVANCASCHGVDAIGKPINHMPTTEDCSVCHAPGSFTTGTYDHNLVVNGCTLCHDNVISIGKLSNHIPTNPDNQDCADCHNTNTFVGATFDHVGIVDNCASCHDGKISIGKSINHVQTDLIQADLDCSSCHITNTFNTFSGTFFHDLTVVDNNCASCHGASIATPKKLNHIPALGECSVCHDDTSSGGFVSATFFTTLHLGITSGCEGCHVSRFIPDNPGAIKAANHLPTSQDCDVCHTNDAFIPSIFDHSGITANCLSCHDGSVDNVAVGARGTTLTHPATDGKDCGVCHNTVNFADATFDHTGRVDNCAECHADNATGAVTKKHIGHVTTTEDCSVCHVPGTFTTAVFNHTGIVDNCASCHDGTVATGKDAKTNPAHIPTTEDCSVCHIPTVFAEARFDHLGIVDNCASCHDGVTARGKSPPPNHVPTNGDCSDCHQTTGFVPGTFDHVGIVDNCSSCHDGAFARGKTGSHVPTVQDCGTCHTTSSFIGAVFNHTGIVNNCASCHDGVTAKGKAAKTNPVHIETALDCHSCHTTATFIGGTWTHDDTSISNCDQCHNDTVGARSKPSGHLNTTVQCDACHSTNGWAPSIFSHDLQGDYPGDHRIDPGCSGCHGNSIDIPFVYDWPQYEPFCAACHANDFDRKGDHIGGENGTVEQNKNCAGSGCHRVTSSEF